MVLNRKGAAILAVHLFWLFLLAVGLSASGCSVLQDEVSASVCVERTSRNAAMSGVTRRASDSALAEVVVRVVVETATVAEDL